MLSHKKWVFGFLLLVLGLGLFVGTRPQKCADTVCTDKRPDAPPYGVPGSYPVGSRVLESGDEPPLAMKMWYPALPEGDLEGETTYPYEIKLGAPLGTVKIASSAGRAVQDASFYLAQGTYPLVVLSPGFAVGATSYGWLAEHLASYGFVVIALEHQETLDPQNELWRAAVTRPQDILAVFAYVDAAVEPGGTLEGFIDPEVTAVIGHSYGGYTALAAAGAQIDSASFKTHCEEARKAENPTAWLCDMLLPQIANMAGLAGLDAIPEGLWPDEADPRVDAIVPMAGDAYFFGQPGLTNVDVPVLAIGGTLDSDTPFLWGPQPTYEHTSSPTKALVALKDAEHMIFTNTCEAIRWYAKWLVGEFCSDSLWNRNQAHDVIGHFTTAFLLAELKQDAAAAATLAPDAVAFPNVTYTAQGY
jgi:predicted dienelactone hydrolase